MRKLIAASLLLASVHLALAGEDEARALIEKSIQAIGGDKALVKHNATVSSDKGTYYGMGDGLPYTGKYSLQFPDQMRMEVENVFTIVFNGKQGWISSMGDVKEMTKEQFETHQHDQRAGYMTSLVPLKDKAFTLKLLKDAKVGEQETRVVEASRKDWPTVKLFFDKGTGYLVKIEFKTKSAELNFKEVTIDHVYSDFKEVDGVKVPHKMVMSRDGKKFVESEVTSYKAVGTLDPKVFAKPE